MVGFDVMGHNEIILSLGWKNTIELWSRNKWNTSSAHKNNYWYFILINFRINKAIYFWTPRSKSTDIIIIYYQQIKSGRRINFLPCVFIWTKCGKISTHNCTESIRLKCWKLKFTNGGCLYIQVKKKSIDFLQLLWISLFFESPIWLD